MAFYSNIAHIDLAGMVLLKPILSRYTVLEAETIGLNPLCVPVQWDTIAENGSAPASTSAPEQASARAAAEGDADASVAIAEPQSVPEPVTQTSKPDTE